MAPRPHILYPTDRQQLLLECEMNQHLDVFRSEAADCRETSDSMIRHETGFKTRDSLYEFYITCIRECKSATAGSVSSIPQTSI